MKNINEELLEAVFNKNISKIEKLLKQGANINYIDSKRDNALLISIRNNNFDMVKYLLENGANPNPDFQTVYMLPLQEAIDTSVQIVNYNLNIEKEPMDIIKLLIEYGANILQKNENGEDAYSFAKNYHIPAQKLFEKIIA